MGTGVGVGVGTGVGVGVGTGVGVGRTVRRNVAGGSPRVEYWSPICTAHVPGVCGVTVSVSTAGCVPGCVGAVPGENAKVPIPVQVDARILPCNGTLSYIFESVTEPAPLPVVSESCVWESVSAPITCAENDACCENASEIVPLHSPADCGSRVNEAGASSIEVVEFAYEYGSFGGCGVALASVLEYAAEYGGAGLLDGKPATAPLPVPPHHQPFAANHRVYPHSVVTNCCAGAAGQ